MQTKINFSLSDARSQIINHKSWGSYVVLDNFLNEDFFTELCNSYNFSKQKFISNYQKKWYRFFLRFNRKSFENSIFTSIEAPRIWRDEERPGVNLVIGGGGSDLSPFNNLFLKSSYCKDLIEWIYSNKGFEYFFNIFSDTPVFNNNISKKDKEDSIISCKLSSQLNNYGDYIHPDAQQKVISFLLYLDDAGWEEDSIGGTDLWEVIDQKVLFEQNKNSLDYKYRNGRFSLKVPSVKLTMEEAEKVRVFNNIEFKPNRLIGFVRNDSSYHAIPPRVLPPGVSRDCLQINIWNLKSRIK